MLVPYLVTASAISLAGTPTVTGVTWTSTTPAVYGEGTFVAPGLTATTPLSGTGAVYASHPPSCPVSTPSYWIGQTSNSGAGYYDGYGPYGTFDVAGHVNFPFVVIVTVKYVPATGETVSAVTAKFLTVEGHRVQFTGTAPYSLIFGGGASIVSLVLDAVSPSQSSGAITGLSPLSNIPSFPANLSYVPYWRVPQIASIELSPSTTVHNSDGSYTFTFNTATESTFGMEHSYNFSWTGTGWVGGVEIWAQQAYGLASLTNTGGGGGTFGVSNPN